MMSLLPFADGARLLGIHPKTLRQWLKQDALELSPHPRDARVKCLTLSQLRHLADLHGRQLPQEITAHPAVAEAEPPCAHNEELLSSTSQDETSLLTKLASLETKVTALTEQVGQLALALLEARDRTIERRLSMLEAAVQDLGGKPLALSAPLMEALLLERGGRRLNPAEERLRSHLPPLIEYRAEGQYVIVSARDGELHFEPDGEEWFEWLATISSFRFVGQGGRFSACRTSERGQHTRCWAARRFFHGHDFWHYLGVTDHLTVALLEQVAATLQARVEAL